ncbi:MAG: haloacid dehalogenase type II [Anderseniella sp.]|nr:haloacid dehalogenase type II [Anderseniella sp.]
MSGKMNGVRACVFDAYGTLFNVHAPVAAMAGRIGRQADQVSKLWRTKQLEYTWLRSLMQAHAPFWQVTGDALDYALAAHGIEDSSLRDDLMQLYLHLEAYPDAVACLKALKAAGFTTGILSNGSPDMLSAAVKSAGLESHLDHVLSIEDVGIFKPDPKVYQLAVDRTGAGDASEICFVSANTWDAQAAKSFGFQVARINRFGLPDDNIPGRPDKLLDSLEQLPAAVS